MDQINFIERGSGRAVIIIHGGKLDHRHMVDALEPVFAGIDGWRRIYIDLPGCGASVGHSNVQSQDDVLERVLSFAEANGDGQPWAVIGESRGSYIAQGIAHRNPDRVAGLCLIVPGGFPAEPPTLMPDARPLIATPELVEKLEPAVRGRAERLVVQTPELFEKIRTLKVPAANVHDPALEARLQNRFLFSFHDSMLATTFGGPSLILSGRQDSITGYSDAVTMLECYPRGTLGLLDCAGHSLSWERPELFTAHIRDWLVRLEQT